MRIVNLFLCLIAFTFFGCAKTQSLYIRNGKMWDNIKKSNHETMSNQSVNDEYQLVKEKCKNLLLGGHYIISGEKLLILIRKWNPGKLFVVDDEYYEKLTIEIGDINIRGQIDINDGGIKLFYSKGGSSWIHQCAGIYSSEGRGKVTIMNTKKNELKAFIDIKLVPLSADQFEVQKEIHIDEKYTLKEISVKDLTPWLGLQNPPLYTGGYP